MAEVIKTDLRAEGKRFGIAVARFNELIANKLLEGTVAALGDHGVRDQDIEVAWVPGSFELPLACRWLVDTGRFDAIVALGTVIRGATSHYDHICAEAARGILETSVAGSIPVAFGVLTCENLDQAMERSSKSNNRGGDAARAALEMLALKSALCS